MSWGIFCGFYLGGVFEGFFGENGLFLWFFDGEDVVKCVVEVVRKQPLLWRVRVRQGG
jgi:hypothetical protein